MSKSPDRRPIDRDSGNALSEVPRPRSHAIPVLEGIRVSWEWLCTPPYQVTLDGAVLAGLSDRPLGLAEVRARLLDRACPLPVRDAVWAHLISRARLDGSTWTLVCAGMALPMLAGVCRTLCGGPSRRGRYGAEVDDVASGIVTGFLEGLAQVDLDRPGLVTALRWGAVRGGHRVLREQRRAPHPLSHDWLVRVVLTPTPSGQAAGERRAGHAVDRARADAGGADADRDERRHGLGRVGRWESAPPPAGGGHPDLVLAAAVADGVLTPAEAALIGETRLEATTLAQVAAREGRTLSAVTMQRLRAEMRLVDHLRTDYYSRHTDTIDDHAADDDIAEDVNGTGDTSANRRAETSQTAAARRRTRRRRPRNVTGRRSRAVRPRTGTCRRSPSPSVNTAGTTPPGDVGSGESGRGGFGRGECRRGDGQVTR